MQISVSIRIFLKKYTYYGPMGNFNTKIQTVTILCLKYSTSDSFLKTRGSKTLKSIVKENKTDQIFPVVSNIQNQRLMILF